MTSEFGLVVESLLLGSLDGVKTLVVHAAKAQGLAGFDEILASLGKKNRLHELTSLIQIEEFSALGVLAHLEDSLGLVEAHVGNGASRDLEEGILHGETRVDD